MLDGSDVVFVERISGRGAVHIMSRPGSRSPAHATSSGLVLLAHCPPAQCQEILSGPLQRFTAHTIVDPKRLRRVLADIRRGGHTITDRHIELVSVSIAAPVRGAGGAVVAALSVVAPVAGPPARHYVPAVVTAARSISRSLTSRGFDG